MVLGSRDLPGANARYPILSALESVSQCPWGPIEVIRFALGSEVVPRVVHLTVIATMAAKYLTPALAGTRARNSKPSPFAATSKAETSKHSKYDGPVASMNPSLKFVAIAFNDYGGIGFEFYSAVVRPYFEGLRASDSVAVRRRRRLGVRAGMHASRSRSSCRESASR